MSLRIAIAAAVVLLVGGIPTDQTAASAQSQREAHTVLTVVGTNDLHGGIVARDGRGGIDVFGGYISNLRALRKLDNGAVLLLDGGDMFQGTLESNLGEGDTVVAAYNALGYTAVAVGNHEFDFGPEGPAVIPRGPNDDPRGALKARATQARFPFLAANIVDSATGQPVVWPNVQPSARVDAGGVAVGIIGVTTSTTLSQTISANTRGLRIAPLVPTIEAHAQKLRAGGATVIMVAAHAGGQCRSFASRTDLSSCDDRAEIFEVARALPPGLVDVIVAGHTHAAVAHVVNGIPIIESYSGGRSFGRIDLSVDRATRRVVSHRLFEPRDVCAEVDPRSGRCDTFTLPGPRAPASYERGPIVRAAAVTAAIAPALARAATLKSRRLGMTADTVITRTGTPESPLGNFFTDALRAASPGADVAIHNVVGGLRTNLPAGPLTYGHLFEVFPFDNQVARLSLTGAQLRRMLTQQLRQARGPVGLSGLRVAATCAGPTLTVTMTDDAGNVVTDQRRLEVVTTDFLVMGGDGIFSPIAPPGGFTVREDAPLARDVIAEWMTARGGRIRAADLVDTTRRRWGVPGAFPVRCGPAAGQPASAMTQ